MRDVEGPIQISIVEYLRLVLPQGFIVHHCKNEINKSGASIAREIARATRMGSVKGFPDLIVIGRAGDPILFLEVKAPGNYPSKDQRAMHEALRGMGHKVVVARSINDAQGALDDWGVVGIRRSKL